MKECKKDIKRTCPERILIIGLFESFFIRVIFSRRTFVAIQDQDPLQAEILREVAEEIREDEYRRLWKKFAPLFTTVVVLILAAASGYEYYKYAKTQNALKESFELQEALVMLGDGKQEDAAASLKEMSENAKSGYRFLAALHYAGVMLEQQKPEQAVAVLDALSANGKAPAPIRNVALISKISIAADLPDADYAALKAQLAPLTDPSNAWAAEALELTALLDLKQNDKEAAKSALQSIVALPNIPEAVRRRASENLALLNAEEPAG